MTSEFTELERHPVSLGIPKKAWPKPVASEVAKWEKAWDEWDKENVKLHDCRDDYVKAEKASREAMLEAVKKGLPDPGELPEVQTAKRAYEFQTERTKHLRKVANEQARKVSEVLKDHSKALFAMACDEAESFASEYPAMVDDLKKRYDDIVKKRQEAYNLLRWVERFTDGKVLYEPSFPLEGSFSVPQTHEGRVWSVVEILRKLYVQGGENES